MSGPSEEMRRDQAQARQLGVAYPVIMPLLEKRRELSYKKLMGAYRDGKEELIRATVAELFVIDGIIKDIDSKVQNYSTAEER